MRIWKELFFQKIFMMKNCQQKLRPQVVESEAMKMETEAIQKWRFHIPG